MKITIVGAGIGGLTAALALHRAGHQVSIMERAARLEPLGAGIVLAPNAVRILQALGVSVEAYGRQLQRATMQTASGTKIQAIEFDRSLSSVGQVLGFHRAELHAALLEALPKDVTLQLDCPFVNGASYGQDVLVGADGINSAVRQRMPGAQPLRYSGYTCWRVVLPDPGIGETFEAWGGAARIGAAPLTRDRIYVFLVLTAPAGMPRQTSMASIRKHFRAFSDPVPTILDTARDVVLLHHDIEDMEVPVWGQGRTVLIGDAAHAMTPNLGQGAAMAIEDAAVLPEVIASDAPAEALRKIRHDRVAKVQQDSRRVGQMAHMKNPVACWLRNALVRYVPRSFSEKQYLRLIEPGLEIARRIAPH
jgi:2-polyprenyl-6-methoxyphenol hydroxylase-like FAD-dependent oxidoreductase